MKKLIAAGATLALPMLAAAHDGHGMSGLHWHASDTVGFIVLAIVAAASLWLGWRK